MKIVRAEAWKVAMPMEEPYAIAYNFSDTAENVFVRLVTDSDITGFGCSAPDLHVTGETAIGTLALFNSYWLPRLAGRDPIDRGWFDELTRIPGRTAALAAIDMALYDIAAKKAGLPLYRYLGGGGHREKILTSITVGILPEKETIARSSHWVGQGFKCLKLKGGNDWREDAARVRKVREAVGKEIGIRFDANQGYTVEDTQRFIEETLGARLEFLEQPTPKEHPEWLGELKSSPVPVMADECLFNGKDAEALADKAGAFNIKLMKTGGITGALPIAEVALRAKLPVMVGCMDESQLGIAAGLAFALSSPAVGYADLDGHIGLKGDPSEGAVRLENGYLYPNPNPGLGTNL
jgi:L-alanine-DL-glutamate epimerase-like enolase superfamily enzyme